jgi:hypothetical protein
MTGSVSAALEPVEAVEYEVECALELAVVIAGAEGTVVGDRESHLRDVRERGGESSAVCNPFREPSKGSGDGPRLG